MAFHRGAELQLAAQAGVIDNMGAVGLQHVLNDADGLGIVVLLDGLCCQLLVAEESRRECLGMFAGNVVQIVGLQVA